MSNLNLAGRYNRAIHGTDNPLGGGADILESVSDGGVYYRLAAGTGTLVTGTIAVATGLNAVTAFTASLNSSGDTATGASEVTSLRVNTIVTGSVTVAGLYHSATTNIDIASASGTSNFYWIAVGT